MDSHAAAAIKSRLIERVPKNDLPKLLRPLEVPLRGGRVPQKRTGAILAVRHYCRPARTELSAIDDRFVGEDATNRLVLVNPPDRFAQQTRHGQTNNFGVQVFLNQRN